MDFKVQCTVLQSSARFATERFMLFYLPMGKIFVGQTVHGTKCSCNISVHRAEFPWIQSEYICKVQKKIFVGMDGLVMVLDRIC